MLERDPDLLARLEACGESVRGCGLQGVVGAQEPRAGQQRCTRTVADSQFEILNTSFMPEGANAEFEAFWSLFEQRPDRQAPRWKLRVRLNRAVELDLGARDALRVAQLDYGGREDSRTQEGFEWSSQSDGGNVLANAILPNHESRVPRLPDGGRHRRAGLHAFRHATATGTEGPAAHP